jgi:tetratricopeptide (TPR) repeat protein
VNPKPSQIAIALVLAGAIAFGWVRWKCESDPKINFLAHEGEASWIIFPAPVDARSHPIAWMDTKFRRTFSLLSKPQTARLFVRVAKRAELTINGETVQLSPTKNWKDLAKADLSNVLRTGENTIEARVFNDDAPPALWVRLDADAFNLRTDTAWEASIAGSSWRKCAFASQPRDSGPGNLLFGAERVLDAIHKVWPVWVTFAFIAILLASAIWYWQPQTSTELSRVQIFIFVGACIAIWIALFWNNAKMLPFVSGYDSQDHLAYIKYIQDRHALPLPNEGYEMFQPPLYYALSAGVLSAARVSAMDTAAVPVLRALTMLFGIANFVFVFLSLRLLFPRQAMAPLIGLVSAAFLPMQLYLSHYVTNETLAGTLASASLYLGLRVLLAKQMSVWQFVSLGACMGAAMLAKATDLLLIPAIFGALVIKLVQQRSNALDWLRTLGSTIAPMVVVCGWQFIRIWRHFGSPFVGNWDPAVGFPLWQDPGFHVMADYFRFGQSLVTPMFSGFYGFADGIYSTLWGESLGGGLSGVLSRTPWNYNLMTAGYWLALIPTLVVIVGAAIAFFRFVRRASPEWFLMVAFPALVVFALGFMTLRIPSYAQVKAFYGLAAVVPFSVFAALGWKQLTRNSRALQFTLLVFFLVFAINSVAAVWIRESSEEHIYAAIRFNQQAQIDRALVEATQATKNDPGNGNAYYVLAAILDETGHSQEAIAECERCLALNPTDGDCHFQLAMSLAKGGDLSKALAEGNQALQLLPENPQVNDLVVSLNLALERRDETISASRDALAVTPFDPDLHYRIGLAAGQFGNFPMAANQLAYAFLLAPQKIEHEQKLRVALSFLQKTPDGLNTLRELESLAASSPKLLEILNAYRQNPNSNPPDQ